MTDAPMRVLFHQHARERMEQRGITEEQVRHCLLNPDVTGPAHRDRTKYTCTLDEGSPISVVAVIRKISDAHFVVYTVYREEPQDD